LGRLRSEDDGDIQKLRKYDEAYRGIMVPLIDEEAIALIAVFGDDGCFGSRHP